MTDRTFLGGMLILHKRVFYDKYDPIMVSCHYSLKKKRCHTEPFFGTILRTFLGSKN
jgi:hypothetical protein